MLMVYCVGAQATYPPNDCYHINAHSSGCHGEIVQGNNDAYIWANWSSLYCGTVSYATTT